MNHKKMRRRVAIKLESPLPTEFIYDIYGIVNVLQPNLFSQGVGKNIF